MQRAAEGLPQEGGGQKQSSCALLLPLSPPLTLSGTEKVGTSTSGCDLAEWLERLAANAKVAAVLGPMPASSDTTVESKGRQIKQC
jgi:hypothetical protein